MYSNFNGMKEEKQSSLLNSEKIEIDKTIDSDISVLAVQLINLEKLLMKTYPISTGLLYIKRINKKSFSIKKESSKVFH